ncbi:hypothetical protein ES731_15110 [Psychroflexus gondwanensis]|uniref:FEKKY domain-containing protein n=1 Tax=Psychroflexus gondwanensis TaxID=251 RepID=UPI0011BF5466|nr:hypothetical protein [Psychroflexus gondwanensis]TXE15676.1 hypothetical protein ES731_15110 [Psychroflexus gondwanensis]
MKKILTLILIGFSFYSFSQESDSDREKFRNIGNLIFSEDADCNKAVEFAESDIKNEEPILLLAGGIAPVSILTDVDFEIKFKVSFYDYGCIQPSEICMEKYNWKIFDYLTEKYGRKWQKEIRNDVVGFKKWKRK